MNRQLILLRLTQNSSIEFSYLEPVLFPELCYYNKGPILLNPDYLLAFVIKPVSLPAQVDLQKVPRMAFLYLTSSYSPLPVPDRPAVLGDDTVDNRPTVLMYILCLMC